MRSAADDLVELLERAHRYLDARGVARSCVPSYATAQLMKETPVSAVSDLFDPHPDEIEHGTLKGAKACRSLGELCFACDRVVRAANRPHSASSSARGTTKAAETAKALDAHRRARKQLQAELAAEAKRSA